jgi:hypothetical protein
VTANVWSNGEAPVKNPRPVLAVTLAAATLAVFLGTIALGGALRAGLAPWPGVAIATMATAASLLSRGHGSLLVAGLLAASGVVGLVYGLVMTEFLAAAAFPGPVFGVILGVPLLGFGVAKGLEAARAGRR